MPTMIGDNLPRCAECDCDRENGAECTWIKNGDWQELDQVSTAAMTLLANKDRLFDALVSLNEQGIYVNAGEIQHLLEELSIGVDLDR